IAHDLDALIGREQRSLTVIPCDADDEPIDDVQRAPDDIGVSVRDRIEGAGVDPDMAAHVLSSAPAPSRDPWVLEPLPLEPSPFPSATPGRRATDTTRSPSSTRNTTTPALPRRAMRISLTGIRMTMPASVTSMIWSLWPTGKTETIASCRRLRSM